MLRRFGTATVFLVCILGVYAGGQADANVKEFAKDIEQLNGSWMSPKIELGPGITGRFELKLEFKKDSSAGRATLLGAASMSGVIVKVSPSWSAELKEKDKKRLIVLADTKDGKRVELYAIAYEVKGDKLNLTSPKRLHVAKGANAIDISGEWVRKKADKK